MGQFRLKVADRVLRFDQRALCTISGFFLFAETMPNCSQMIAALAIILVVIAVNDGDWHLAIANKAASVVL